MWLKRIDKIQAKLALASLLGLLVMVVGCAKNGSGIAESADESTSSKVANATAEKQSYFSRLASLRKREVVEDQPLVRDAFFDKNEEIQNPFGQLVANKALSNSLPESESSADTEMVAEKNKIPANPFLVSHTKTKQTDKSKFMSMDQFLATVESSPAPTQKKNAVADLKVAETSTVSPFPGFDSEKKEEVIEEKKSLFASTEEMEEKAGFAFLAENKPKEKMDWNPDSDAKLWTPGVDQKGSAVDPAFAKFSTEPELPEQKKVNPLTNLVEATKPSKTTLPNSSIDPAFAGFKTDAAESEEEITGLNIAEMKSPFETEEDSSIETSETALSKLRADLEEKASNTKKAAVVASSDERVRSVIQKMLTAADSLMDEGHLASANQFVSEAKELADHSEIMFGPNDLRPDDFVQKIASRMQGAAKSDEMNAESKDAEVLNASLSTKNKIADARLKKETSKTLIVEEKKSEVDELPLIVSSPLKEYRAKPGSGFNVAMVRSNAPVSLASFITNVPEKSESKKEQRTPLFDFENEHKQKSNSRISAIQISKTSTSIPANTNRSLILKSPELAGEIPTPKENDSEKSFLPNSINLNLPDFNDDAPLPKVASGDSLVMLPSSNSSRDLELKTQKAPGSVSSFQFPESIYDGSRGPVIPMLASFLGGAFLITMLLYFRRR